METQDYSAIKADIQRRLLEPFHRDELEWRIGFVNESQMQGQIFAYVTNRAIQTRLDEVFGIFNWCNSYIAWKEKSQLCGISVKDPETGEWITKYDGSDDTDFQSTKGGLSDSMKRAAAQFGIGRYLYRLPIQYATVEKSSGRKTTYRIPKSFTPILPDWALPEDERGKEQHRRGTASAGQAASSGNGQQRSNMPADTHRPAKPLSDAQLRRLWAIGKKHGKTQATIEKECHAKYGRLPASLEKYQYDELCTHYESMAA